MYSFDLTEEDAKTAYNKVCSAYDRLFDRLSLPIQKGKVSHFGCAGSNIFYVLLFQLKLTLVPLEDPCHMNIM